VTKENRDKTLRLAGKLLTVGSALKDASSDVLMSDQRTRDLIDVAQAAVDKAVLSAWEKAESEPVEG
jgi:hypothetical protein